MTNLLYFHPTTLLLHLKFSAQRLIRSLLTVNQLKGVPLDIGRKLNVRNTFMRSPRPLLNVLRALNLSSVSKTVSQKQEQRS